MKKAKIFINGRSQAVRLPKEFRFNNNEVFIEKVGNIVKLIPTNYSWDSLVNSLDQFSDDFMLERTQPNLQERTEFL